MSIRIFTFIIMIFCLVSCGTETASPGEVNTTVASTTAEKKAAVSELPLEVQIENKMKEEIATGEKNDTIVLDFRFGMSKRDVYKHTKKLYADGGKMYPVQKTKKTREYVYDLRLRDAGKLRTYFDAFYHDKKLYKVECLPRLKADQEPGEILKEINKTIFTPKYGKPHFRVPSEEDENCKTYLWIDGNRRIELGCEDDKVFIYYIDMPLAEAAIKDGDF